MSDAVVKEISPPGEVRLHHVGFVLNSIQNSADSFARSLGATWDGNIVFDPIQKVRVTFFQGAHPQDSLIELVEPGGPDSPVSRFLTAGGGLHHLCYEVEDLEGHLRFCKSAGAAVLRRPTPAVAFGGRRISWAITPQKLLLEFLEKKGTARGFDL